MKPEEGLEFVIFVAPAILPSAILEVFEVLKYLVPNLWGGIDLFEVVLSPFPTYLLPVKEESLVVSRHRRCESLDQIVAEHTKRRAGSPLA